MGSGVSRLAYRAPLEHRVTLIHAHSPAPRSLAKTVDPRLLQARHGHLFWRPNSLFATSICPEIDVRNVPVCKQVGGIKYPRNLGALSLGGRGRGALKSLSSVKR